jgi:hypothetical protein
MKALDMNTYHAQCVSCANSEAVFGWILEDLDRSINAERLAY